MKIWYLEEEGIKEFDEQRAKNAPNGRWAEKREKITDPMTITLHIEIDKKKYAKLQEKYKTSLAYRIFSYFGFKNK